MLLYSGIKEGYLDTFNNTTLWTLCEVINLRTERKILHEFPWVYNFQKTNLW